MSILNELYQEMIVDHGRKPRNFHALEHANTTLEGFNPLCGDRLTVYISERENIIDNISFQGNGCAISIASASLMTERIKGMSVADAKALFTVFHNTMTGKHIGDATTLGKLSVLSGVAQFPSRIKCATLAWHTLIGALNHVKQTVSTEDEK